MNMILGTLRIVRGATWGLLLGLTSYAGVTLPPVFSDNMVLQQGQPVPVWGKASPGETVTVLFAGQSRSTVAEVNGAWRVQLEAMSVSNEPRQLEVISTSTVRGKPVIFNNVVVGEVWLCTGQSNMGFQVERSEGGSAAVAAADNRQIRLWTYQGTGWLVCTPSSVATFSAAGYFFGRALQKELGVPVGLLNISIGGASTESFMSSHALASLGNGKIEQMRNSWYESNNARYNAAVAEWKKDCEAAAAAGRALPPTPLGKPKRESPKDFELPSTHWPWLESVIPYSIAGALWYQGEANALTVEMGLQQRNLLPALIKSWRQAWGRDFAFLAVQLPSFDAGNPKGETWAIFRESQAKALATVGNAGMVVAIDLGNPSDAHPTRKEPVGQRLANLALRTVYGGSRDISGPELRSIQFAGGEARVKFDHAKALRSITGQVSGGFLIAGADHKFRPAAARIDGDTVVVSSAQVATPVAVRYAWANSPVADLYNAAGLPAAPFRSDSWELKP
jgi:sialate O-acetylesterase